MMTRLLRCLTLYFAALLMWPSVALAEEAVSALGPKKQENQREIASLMFSKTDINNLMKVMKARAYLDGDTAGDFDFSEYAEYGEAEILREIQRRAIQEQEERRAETTLPDFYLSSMIYRSEKDWTVWIRKHVFQPKVFNETTQDDARSVEQETVDLISQQTEAVSDYSELIILSSKQPEGDRGRMKVAVITNDSVTLIYRPDAGAAAFNRYKKRDEEPPRLLAFNNRVVPSSFVYDEESNQLLFSLQPNQTFSINMMRLIEGTTINKKANASRALATAQREAAARAARPRPSNQSIEARESERLLNNEGRVRRRSGN